MRKRVLVFGAAAVAVLAGASLGVDGIAISHRATSKYPQPRFAPLMRYAIHDDTVAGERVIHEGGARWPRFSPDGERVAFFRQDGDRRYLSVMSIDGGQATDLHAIDNNGGGILEWPVGPWIYFTTTSDRNDEEGKTLYRIDSQNPGAPEPVVTIDYVYWSGGMSADGARGFFTYYRPGLYTMRFDGASAEASRLCEHNCGSTISPSGAYLAHFFDGSHYDFVLRQWPETGDPSECLPGEAQLIEYVRGDSLNRWGAATSRFSYTCDWTNAPSVTIGGGGKMNRWSRNSDKWLSVSRGWPCGGRFDRCNSNQVLVNWVDRKAIVVSGHGRMCEDRGQCCDIVEEDQTLYAEAGDFWVTAPEEDILPAFRQASASRPRTRPRPARQGVDIHFHRGAGALTPSHAAGRTAYGIDGRLLRHDDIIGPGIIICH
jgi:hypothetical protein